MADSTMRYVSGDTLAHVMVVNVRDMARICGQSIKRTGAGLPANDCEIKNLVLCRKLHQRMVAGDYRMTETEHRRFIDAVNWLQRQDRLNKKQSDKPPMEVLDAYVWSSTKLPRYTYEGLMMRLADGSLDTVASQ